MNVASSQILALRAQQALTRNDKAADKREKAPKQPAWALLEVVGEEVLVGGDADGEESATQIPLATLQVAWFRNIAETDSRGYRNKDYGSVALGILQNKTRINRETGVRETYYSGPMRGSLGLGYWVTTSPETFRGLLTTLVSECDSMAEELQKERARKEQAKVASSEPTWNCSNGHMVPISMGFCGHCGAARRPDTAVRTPQPVSATRPDPAPAVPAAPAAPAAPAVPAAPAAPAVPAAPAAPAVPAWVAGLMAGMTAMQEQVGEIAGEVATTTRRLAALETAAPTPTQGNSKTRAK